MLDQFGIDRLAGQSILNEVGLATGCQLSFDEFAQGIKIKSSGDAGIQLAKSKLFNLEWFLVSLYSDRVPCVLTNQSSVAIKTTSFEHHFRSWGNSSNDWLPEAERLY